MAAESVNVLHMGNACITPTTIMAADVPINFLIFEFPLISKIHRADDE